MYNMSLCISDFSCIHTVLSIYVIGDTHCLSAIAASTMRIYDFTLTAKFTAESVVVQYLHLHIYHISQKTGKRKK